jgi:hypothetical protein
MLGAKMATRAAGELNKNNRRKRNLGWTNHMDGNNPLSLAIPLIFSSISVLSHGRTTLGKVIFQGL